jgi:RNA polymerase sigma-70 factor, ECF subfamily
MDGHENGLIQGEHLLAAAQSGDTSALWQLADTFRPYLKSVVARMLCGRLNGKVDASDVIQLGMVAAVEHFPQFQGRTVVEWQGWLVAIVRNEVLNLLRYWNQEVRDVGRENHLPSGSGGSTLAQGSSTPSRIASEREHVNQLMAAIERLSPDYRQVIELRNLEELPFVEVATRMRRSDVAVRQLWVRAVRRLREELGERP